MTDIDIVEAVEYYTTPRGQSVNSPNKLNFTSMGSVIGFDAFHLAGYVINAAAANYCRQQARRIRFL